MSIKQITKLRYKTKDKPPMEGVPLLGYNTSSKTCSRCGWKNKDLKLSDRTFVCKDCGMEIDRDLNAAINIQAVGVDAAIRTQSSRVASCVEASKME
jgi:transposase